MRYKLLLFLLIFAVVGAVNASAAFAATTVEIVDKIKAELSEANRGRLVAIPSESGTYTFEWYRSTDGSSWNKIERKKTITVFGHDYYNMSETGDWIDPSVDRLASSVTEDSKRLVYKVKIATKNGSPVGTEIMSTPYRIPYYCALMNGDFENLLIPGNLYPYPWSGNSSASNPGGKYWVSSDLTDAQIKANVTPVYGSYFVYERHEEELIWKTTDKFGCLEIINASPDKSVNPSTSASYNKGTYQNFVLNNLLSGIKTGGANGATHNGEQMAELNSESVATLYQDVLTIPGTELKWDIWHRARAVTGAEHIDKMRVLIMDSYLAEILLSMYPEDPQQAVVYIVNHLDEFPGAFVSEELTADVYKWSEHDGEYNVPENQNLTRMFFVSESGNPGMGNFLDEVTFSVTTPLPKYDEAVINLHKTISGKLSESAMSVLKKQIKFKITVDGKEETVEGKDLLWISESDGNWVANFRKVCAFSESETEKSYEIEEDKESASISQYTLSYSDSGNTKGKLNLTDKKSIDVKIENSYSPVSDLIIEKSGMKKGESAIFTVTKKGENAPLYTVPLTVNDSTGSAEVKLENVLFGEYTVEETSWSWAYEKLDPKTQDISKNNKFTFVNKPKDTPPPHAEANVNNKLEKKTN